MIDCLSTANNKRATTYCSKCVPAFRTEVEFGPNAAVLVFVERRNSEKRRKASRSKKGINNKLYLHTPISKNVGENGEWQLSNGNCTTERNCGFHICKKKTMSSSQTRWQQKPHRFAYLTMENTIFARFARAFFFF